MCYVFLLCYIYLYFIYKAISLSCFDSDVVFELLIVFFLTNVISNLQIVNTFLVRATLTYMFLHIRGSTSQLGVGWSSHFIKVYFFYSCRLIDIVRKSLCTV